MLFQKLYKIRQYSWIIVLLALVIPVIMYPLIILYDWNTAKQLLYSRDLYPLEISYTIRSDQSVLSTLQFAFIYNVSYILKIQDIGRISVEHYNYSVQEILYVKKSRVNKTLYDEVFIDKNEMYKLLFLKDSSIYYIGLDKVDELLSTRNTINIRIGKNIVPHRYIIINNRIVLIYRGEDIIRLRWLGNSSFSIIITRAAYLLPNGEIPNDIKYYNLTLYYFRYSGLVYQVIYTNDVTGQSLVFVLDGVNNPVIKKYVSSIYLYERIIDVDRSKYIAFNLVSFFALLIIWNILIGYYEGRKLSLRSLVTGGIGALLLLISTILLMTYPTTYILPLLYLGAALCRHPLILMEDNKVYRKLLLLVFAGVIALFLFSNLLITWFPGSLYKIGIESSLANKTEENVTINLLLERGIDPVLLTREYAYYYIFTGLYTQLIFFVIALSTIIYVVLKCKSNRLLLILLLTLPAFIAPILFEPRIAIARSIVFGTDSISLQDIPLNSILSLQLLSFDPYNIIGYSIIILLTVSLLTVYIMVLYRNRSLIIRSRGG